mgnify:CR=1 FL=1
MAKKKKMNFGGKLKNMAMGAALGPIGMMAGAMKKKNGGKKMYREGGSSDINASYKDFLDL